MFCDDVDGEIGVHVRVVVTVRCPTAIRSHNRAVCDVSRVVEVRDGELARVALLAPARVVRRVATEEPERCVETTANGSVRLREKS